MNSCPEFGGQPDFPQSSGHYSADPTLSDTTIVDGLNGKLYMVDYNNCNSGMPVRAIAIENKEHGWPGFEESG